MRLPMLSLHVAADEKEVARFDEFVHSHANGSAAGYFLEPKFDGVSVELVYKDGEFKLAATRGDGQHGDNVSDNLRTGNGFPARLRRSKLQPTFLSARGEAYLSKNDFQKMNKERVVENLEPFANPRNAAAGILHRLEAEVADAGDCALWSTTS